MSAPWAHAVWQVQTMGPLAQLPLQHASLRLVHAVWQLQTTGPVVPLLLQHASLRLVVAVASCWQLSAPSFRFLEIVRLYDDCNNSAGLTMDSHCPDRQRQTIHALGARRRRSVARFQGTILLLMVSARETGRVLGAAHVLHSVERGLH